MAIYRTGRGIRQSEIHFTKRDIPWKTKAKKGNKKKLKNLQKERKKYLFIPFTCYLEVRFTSPTMAIFQDDLFYIPDSCSCRNSYIHYCRRLNVSIYVKSVAFWFVNVVHVKCYSSVHLLLCIVIWWNDLYTIPM